jgi:hypothetical protein
MQLKREQFMKMLAARGGNPAVANAITSSNINARGSGSPARELEYAAAAATSAVGEIESYEQAGLVDPVYDMTASSGGGGGGGSGAYGGFGDVSIAFGADHMVVENMTVLANALMKKVNEQQEIIAAQQRTLMMQQDAIMQLQQQMDQYLR